jgi:arylformamidase
MNIIDISLPIHRGMLTYPGDPDVSVTRIVDMTTGEMSNLSVLSMSTHTGTHVDPPLHFLAAGTAIDLLPLEVLIGDVFVADMRGLERIGADELARTELPEDVERLLFLTDRSATWSEPDLAFPSVYPALTVEGATWIVDRGIRLVGIDFLSIEVADDGTFPVHRTLLAAGIPILEGLDLRKAPLGRSTLWCLPLKIRNGDGGPARAILVAD